MLHRVRSRRPLCRWRNLQNKTVRLSGFILSLRHRRKSPGCLLTLTHRPQPKRRYFDVGLGAICLAGADTGGAFCLLDVSLAPGIGVPRHTHTREDETYYVLSGELEVEVGDPSFLLRPGDTLLAPRNIPHQLKNTGTAENRYLLVFSPAGFENFILMQRRSPLRKALQLKFGLPNFSRGAGF
jgi:quercetin dioxygenase-like cupin family protein